MLHRTLRPVSPHALNTVVCRLQNALFSIIVLVWIPC